MRPRWLFPESNTLNNTPICQTQKRRAVLIIYAKCTGVTITGTRTNVRVCMERRHFAREKRIKRTKRIDREKGGKWDACDSGCVRTQPEARCAASG